MYQLYREGGAAHGEGSDALFQTAQAMWHQLSFVCHVCQRDPVFLYPGGESGLPHFDSGGVDSRDCGDFL